jgi:hypothetical protein
MSQANSKYPEQSTAREALDKWVIKQKSLSDAAAELMCTYRELSSYRHGHRWIPDRIVEFLGLDPRSIRRARAKRPNKATAKHMLEKQIVKAALDLFHVVSEYRREVAQ